MNKCSFFIKVIVLARKHEILVGVSLLKKIYLIGITINCELSRPNYVEKIVKILCKKSFCELHSSKNLLKDMYFQASMLGRPV